MIALYFLNNKNFKALGKISIRNIFLHLLVFAFPFLSINAQKPESNISIIPAPVSMIKTDGVFVFSANTVIKVDDPGNKTIAFFTSYLQDTWNFKNKLIIGGHIRQVKKES